MLDRNQLNIETVANALGKNQLYYDLLSSFCNMDRENLLDILYEGGMLSPHEVSSFLDFELDTLKEFNHEIEILINDDDRLSMMELSQQDSYNYFACLILVVNSAIYHKNEMQIQDVVISQARQYGIYSDTTNALYDLEVRDSRDVIEQCRFESMSGKPTLEISKLKREKDFIGIGTKGIVFKKRFQGKEFALKLPKYSSLSASEAYCLLKQKDIKGTSQIIFIGPKKEAGFSYFLLEYETGLPINKVSMSDIKDSHISELGQLYLELKARGIYPDIGDVNNIIYDSITGFTILDSYEVPDIKTKEEFIKNVIEHCKS